MLWAVQTVVLVLFQLFDDVSWHGDVNRLIFVVPFQFYTAIQISHPIFSQLVLFFDAPNQVVNVLLHCVFYTEVINNQREQYWLGGMLPKTLGLFAFVVNMWGQPFSEEFICEYSSLWQSPHRVTYFKVDIPVVYMVQEIVLLNDLRWEHADGCFHVFITVKWCR